MDQHTPRRLRRLAGTTLAYGFGSAATALVSILAVPILTRLLDPAEYGSLDLATTLLSILTVVTQLGFAAVLVVFYRRGSTGDERRSSVRTGLAVVTATSVSVGVTGALLFSVAAAFSSQPAIVIVVGVLTFLWLPVNVIGTSALDLLRAQFRAAAFSIMNVARALVATVVGLIFVAAGGLGSAGIVGAQVIVGAVFAMGTLVLLRRDLRGTRSRELAGRMIRFGLPLVPAGIAAWVMVFGNRLFLLQFGSLADVGAYALAVRVASVATIATVAINSAWTPFAVEEARSPGHRAVYARALALIAAGLVVVVIVLALAAPEIIALAAPSEYASAAGPVGFLALGTAISALTACVAIGLQLADRTSGIAAAAGVAAVGSLLLNIALVPPFGVIGAAIATCGALLVQLLVTLALAHLRYPVPYHLGQLATTIFAGVAASAVAIAASASPPIRLATAVLGIALVVGVTWRSAAHEPKIVAQPPRR